MDNGKLGLEVLKERVKLKISETAKTLGIIGMVFALAHFHGPIYLWLLFLLCLV